MLMLMEIVNCNSFDKVKFHLEPIRVMLVKPLPTGIKVIYSTNFFFKISMYLLQWFILCSLFATNTHGI